MQNSKTDYKCVKELKREHHNFPRLYSELNKMKKSIHDIRIEFNGEIGILKKKNPNHNDDDIN